MSAQFDSSLGKWWREIIDRVTNEAACIIERLRTARGNESFEALALRVNREKLIYYPSSLWRKFRWRNQDSLINITPFPRDQSSRFLLFTRYRFAHPINMNAKADKADTQRAVANIYNSYIAVAAIGAAWEVGLLEELQHQKTSPHTQVRNEAEPRSEVHRRPSGLTGRRQHSQARRRHRQGRPAI